MTYPYIAHVSIGGPTYKIAVRGKFVPFEMHPYFGPHPVHKKSGDPLLVVPSGFFEAIDLWIRGGKRTDGDLCIVPRKCRKCEGTGDKVRHLGGKHYEIVGRCEACGGDGFKFWHLYT